MPIMFKQIQAHAAPATDDTIVSVFFNCLYVLMEFNKSLVATTTLHAGSGASAEANKRYTIYFLQLAVDYSCSQYIPSALAPFKFTNTIYPFGRSFSLSTKHLEVIAPATAEDRPLGHQCTIPVC